MARAAVVVIAFVLALVGCGALPSPVPTGAPATASTPLVTGEPADETAPSSDPGVPCGPQILVGDSTGQLLSCEDLGTVATNSVAPHVANNPANPAQIRIWWTVETCASTWWVDIHNGAYGLTVIDLKDGEHPACPAYTVGRAMTVVFRPFVSAGDVVQLHNGMPVISTRPVGRPPANKPITYPSTPASIQFGRWELAQGENPTRDATEIHVVVYEKACASGDSPESRILEPFLAYDERDVWVAFGIWSLAGVQSCEPGPGVPYTVSLSEPVARRHLKDGARLIESYTFFRSDCPFWSGQNGC